VSRRRPTGTAPGRVLTGVVCVAGVVYVALSVGCKREPKGPWAAPQDKPVSWDAAAMDEREQEAWAQADGGEPGELVRLADRVGCESLRERAAVPVLRGRALRAMAFCPDLGEVGWLAEVATSADEADALAALDAVVDEAAAPRRSTDPEDAEELHEGCGKLLTLAKNTSGSKARRVLAVRALRMLAERGCVVRAEIPTDLDAK
jgi:hypothetical protein